MCVLQEVFRFFVSFHFSRPKTHSYPVDSCDVLVMLVDKQCGMTCSISWPKARPAFPWQLAGCRLWSVTLVRIYLETIAPSPQVPHLFQKVRNLQESDIKKSQKPSRLWAKEQGLSDWQHGIWLQLSDFQCLWLKRDFCDWSYLRRFSS